MSAPLENRAAIFERLIEFARVHELEKYQTTAFYQKIVAQNPSAFVVIESVADQLIEAENYTEALNLLRESKKQFPARSEIFLEKEVDLLILMNSFAEVEKVYLENFDPFWSEKTTKSFYNFLDSQNRLRAYGKDLKDALKRNLTDFKIAIRLIQYQQNDGIYDNDSVAGIISKLEASRTAAKIEWSADELVAMARILLAENEADTASRFLYTLHLKGGFASQANCAARFYMNFLDFLLMLKTNKSRSQKVICSFTKMLQRRI